MSLLFLYVVCIYKKISIFQCNQYFNKILSIILMFVKRQPAFYDNYPNFVLYCCMYLSIFQCNQYVNLHFMTIIRFFVNSVYRYYVVNYRFLYVVCISKKISIFQCNQFVNLHFMTIIRFL